ncbi:MAG: hypothetical protein HQK99_02010 [Nitrospirae bacterium]|nr:hypothetical protein [Nitrospirota bacterium]
MDTDRRQDLIAGLTILILLFVCYYQILLKADFLTTCDCVYSYDNANETAKGNGWRPDKAWGISFFYGDPAVHHPWSIFSLLLRLVPSHKIAYTAAILFLLFLAAFSNYCLLKKLLPDLNKLNWMILPMLSLLVVFTPGQMKYSNDRIWTALSICAPLLIILLHDYLQKPKFTHLFYCSILFWFSFFTGSYVCINQLAVLELIFIVIYYLYYKPSLKPFLLKIAALNIFTLFWLILLGSWTFYSLIVEHSIMDYERPITRWSSLLTNIAMSNILAFATDLFHTGWFQESKSFIGLEFFLKNSWRNCSIIFPFVMIYFVFKKSNDFWEYSVKWITIFITVFFTLAIDNLPFIGYILERIFKGYGFNKYYLMNYTFQIALIGIFISNLNDKNNITASRTGRFLQRILAVVLVIVYLTLTIASILILTNYDFFFNYTLRIADRCFTSMNIPSGVASGNGYFKDYLLEIIRINIKIFKSGINWNATLYYLLTIIIVLPFIKDKWLFKAIKIRKYLIVILLLHAILLSWSLYPLNRDNHYWKNDFDSNTFKPTDRFYFVREDKSKFNRDINILKKDWLYENGDVKEKMRDFLLTPGLCLSSNVSIISSDTRAFSFLAFNNDGKERIKEFRDVESGPLYSSGLLDLGAVTYYYSLTELYNLPVNLTFYKSTKDIYIYRNLSAWPYYYLADVTQTIDSLSDLASIKSLRKGAAYIYDKNLQIAPKGKSYINMTLFSFGKMEFDYSGESENLLIVADAWHPFWRASNGSGDLKVIRANGIFKGVVLPKGSYAVRLFFDTSPYVPGIYIAIASWFIFLAIWIVYYKRPQKFDNMLNRTFGGQPPHRVNGQ